MNLENTLVGLKTIIGVIIQIASGVLVVGTGIMDYMNSVPGNGVVKATVGLGIVGNAISQAGIRFAKKTVVINETPAVRGPNEGLIPPSKVVGEIVDSTKVAPPKQ